MDLAIAAEGVNASAVVSEAARATAAEGVLTANLAQELLDRAAGENSHKKKLP